MISSRSSKSEKGEKNNYPKKELPYIDILTKFELENLGGL